MEKKIMNPADICTTFRLPTRVSANRPAFSLYGSQEKHHMKVMKNRNKKAEKKVSYTETDDPFPVPKSPESKMATP